MVQFSQLFQLLQGPLPNLLTLMGSALWCGSSGSSRLSSLNARSTVDIKAVANWIRSRGWFGDVTIGNVQFGYEITSSSGGRDFVTNRLTITAS